MAGMVGMGGGMLMLTEEEAKEIYAVIDELSGFNARDCFAWDGTDSLKNTRTRALAKLFRAAGRDVPDSLKDEGK